MNEPQKYTIACVEAHPNWDTVPTLAIDCDYTEGPAAVKAYGQICCNSSAILVHLWAEQQEVRAEEQGPLGMPCKDSCLEFFFCPNEADMRYLNIEFNINKCLFLGIGSNLQNLSRIIISDVENMFNPQTKRTEDGWEIFFQIPYAFVQRFFPAFQVFDGKTIRANCYTCSEASAVPYNLSWNRIQVEPLTFHWPEDFGIMTFRFASDAHM